MHAFLKNNWLGLLLIFGTWLAFFWRIPFNGRLYFLDDLKIIYYPLEYIFAAAQSAWQLPAWSPLFGFGQPLLAWGQLGFFAPLHLILRFFPLHPLLLLNISVMAYFAAGLAGMYAFLRRMKLTQIPAALGAVVFAFCGFNIGHLNHVNFYTATMLLPWLMLAINYFIARPSGRSTAFLALLAAAVPLSGQPQISLYVFVIAGVYGVIELISGRQNLRDPARRGRLFRLLVLTGLLAAALASFAILPLTEFLPLTDRGADLSPQELYEFSYPVEHLKTLINPYAFGDHSFYWGAKNFQELAAYVGFAPLILAPLGLFWPNKKHAALRLTGAVLFLVALAFAPGMHSPVYVWLVESHIWPALAVPGRFVFFFDVAVAMLAAVGIQSAMPRMQGATPRIRAEKILALPEEFSRRVIRGVARGVIIPAIAIFTSANLVYWGWDYNPMVARDHALTPSPFTDTLKANAEEPGLPAGQAGLPPRLYSAEYLPITGTRGSLRAPTEPVSPLFTIRQPFTIGPEVSCVYIPAESDTAANSAAVKITLRDAASDEAFFQMPITPSDLADSASVSLCSPAIASRAGREVVMSLTSPDETGIKFFQRPIAGGESEVLYIRVADPTPEQLTRSRKNAHLVIEQEKVSGLDLEKDLLLRHIHVTSDTSAARWIGALSIENYRAFIEQFFANDRDPFDGEGIHALLRYRNLVNMAGITHLAHALPAGQLAEDPVLAAGYTLVEESVQGSTHLRLYENPRAFPKAFLVKNGVWEPGPDQTRHGLSRADFDPTRIVYLSGPKPPEDGIVVQNSENIDLDQFQPVAAGEAAITRYESTRVDVAVKTPEPAWLILTDSYTPQWQTFIDDAPAPQYVANSIFRAAYVEPGEHVVSFRYHSPAILYSKILTTLALIVIATLLAYPIIVVHWKRWQNQKNS